MSELAATMRENMAILDKDYSGLLNTRAIPTMKSLLTPVIADLTHLEHRREDKPQATAGACH